MNLALVAIAVYGMANEARGDLKSHVIGADTALRECVGQAFVVALFASLCGAQMVTRQLRDRVSSLLYLARPSWPQILSVKALAAAILGVVFGLFSTALAMAVAYAALSPAGGSLGSASSRLWWLAAGIVLLGAFGGAWGVLLGALIRKHALTLAGLVVWSVGLEGGLIALLPAVGRWLPGGAQAAIVADPDLPDRLGPVGGVTLLVGWLVAAAVLAVLSLRRRPALAAG
ncbi:hypothetical protein [Frankia sp. AgB32]|uniref:hypothetical protein n=1 Tax=Frankia sp. AgB32 TaxID=631119 RepID=UPI00200D38DC|nr:hypothetical protein [Frankia sp. AgB32]MCK9896272.1 hypothetical protein [Frankia sp. AgB32]